MADQKFDEATQKELAQFLDQQQAEARMNNQIHKFTGMCWDKCMTGSIGGRFSRSEESCLVNCVDRFLDTSLFLMKKIDEQQGRTN
ncbi:putative TIM8-translocase of the mitochondrial inner membrane [Serendipita vermifera]|nr:putative TIM8-translocase of the mitochondrial inner membrane [Serendipita vermifera]